MSEESQEFDAQVRRENIERRNLRWELLKRKR